MAAISKLTKQDTKNRVAEHTVRIKYLESQIAKYTKLVADLTQEKASLASIVGALNSDIKPEEE